MKNYVVPFLLLPFPLLFCAPAFSQENLNAQLRSDICTGNWAAAISTIDLMLPKAPAYRGTLLVYRSRLQSLLLSSAPADGSSCASSSASAPPSQIPGDRLLPPPVDNPFRSTVNPGGLDNSVDLLLNPP